MEDNSVAVRKGVKRRYKVIAVVFLVLAVGFGVVFMRGKSKLGKKLDEIRAAGFPVTLEELYDWYSIPEGEKMPLMNMLLLLRAIMRRIIRTICL